MQALREKLPAHFQTPCRLPNPAPDHKRLPVQPELVDAYNQRMLDTYTIIQTSLKLSLPPTDCGQLETVWPRCSPGCLGFKCGARRMHGC